MNRCLVRGASNCDQLLTKNLHRVTQRSTEGHREEDKRLLRFARNDGILQGFSETRNENQPSLKLRQKRQMINDKRSNEISF
jgi:hypothetical protein